MVTEKRGRKSKRVVELYSLHLVTEKDKKLQKDIFQIFILLLWDNIKGSMVRGGFAAPGGRRPPIKRLDTFMTREMGNEWDTEKWAKGCENIFIAFGYRQV